MIKIHQQDVSHWIQYNKDLHFIRGFIYELLKESDYSYDARKFLISGGFSINCIDESHPYDDIDIFITDNLNPVKLKQALFQFNWMYEIDHNGFKNLVTPEFNAVLQPGNNSILYGSTDLYQNGFFGYVPLYTTTITSAATNIPFRVTGTEVDPTYKPPFRGKINIRDWKHRTSTSYGNTRINITEILSFRADNYKIQFIVVSDSLDQILQTFDFQTVMSGILCNDRSAMLMHATDTLDLILNKELELAEEANFNDRKLLSRTEKYISKGYKPIGRLAKWIESRNEQNASAEPQLLSLGDNFVAESNSAYF